MIVFEQFGHEQQRIRISKESFRSLKYSLLCVAAVNFAVLESVLRRTLSSSSITSLEDLFAAIIIQEINDSTFPDFVWKPSRSVYPLALLAGKVISVNSSL
jgi:hypothetical protein